MSVATFVAVATNAFIYVYLILYCVDIRTSCYSDIARGTPVDVVFNNFTAREHFNLFYPVFRLFVMKSFIEYM